VNLIITARGANTVQYLLTEFPAGLDEGNLGVVHKERDSPREEIRLGLEIGVEHGNVLAVFDVVVLQAFLERARLVPLPVPSDLVLYVDAFAPPSLALHLYQILNIQNYIYMYTNPIYIYMEMFIAVSIKVMFFF
jgi:hypothetical protein